MAIQNNSIRDKSYNGQGRRKRKEEREMKTLWIFTVAASQRKIERNQIFEALLEK